MLIVSKFCNHDQTPVAELLLPFDERKKSRFRTFATCGEEVGIFLERGTVLKGGDLLLSEDGRAVLVRAADEILLHITQHRALSLVHVAYHLGNRHVPIQIGENWLRIARDEVLKQMVEGLGARAEDAVAPFHPEHGAYGGGHTHGEKSDRDNSPIIHEFGRYHANG